MRTRCASRHAAGSRPSSRSSTRRPAWSSTSPIGSSSSARACPRAGRPRAGPRRDRSWLAPGDDGPRTSSSRPAAPRPTRTATSCSAPGSTPAPARPWGDLPVLACSADLADSTSISGLRRGPRGRRGLRLVRARHQPRRSPAAAADHRVPRTPAWSAGGLGQPERGPRGVVQWLLGCVQHYGLQLPEVRPHAPLQPARAGLRLEVGKVIWVAGHSSRDGRGQPHPLRDLRLQW